MTMAAKIRPLIVGVGGTTRPNSATERALRVALKAAKSKGAETIFIGGTELQFPMYEPTDMTRTNDIRKFLELIRRCHGLVIASPGYHGSVSGMIKNALDYIEDLRTDQLPYLDGRAVGCIACASGWQATGPTLAAMRSIVHALRGWPTPMGVALNTAMPLFDSQGSCTDPLVNTQLQLVGHQVLEFANMRRKHASRCNEAQYCS
jgi:FMN reductase